MIARATGVRRRFGPRVALDGLDLDVHAGETLGLLGPNGAGKSTLISLLVGLRRPDAGTVELFGGDPRDAANRRGLGVTPQETGLPQALRVGEVVRFVAGHFPRPLPPGEVLERFGLAGLERRQTGGLSGGQKRRLAVALAFVGRPRFVVLDEPTTGLDVDGRRTLWGGDPGLPRRRRDRAPHEPLPRRDREPGGSGRGRGTRPGGGRGDGAGGPREGRPQPGHVPSDDPPPLEDVVIDHRDGDRWELQTPDADSVIRRLVRTGVPFHDLQVRPSTLEEAFVSLTGDGAPTGGPS